MRTWSAFFECISQKKSFLNSLGQFCSLEMFSNMKRNLERESFEWLLVTMVFKVSSFVMVFHLYDIKRIQAHFSPFLSLSFSLSLSFPLSLSLSSDEEKLIKEIELGFGVLKLSCEKKV